MELGPVLSSSLKDIKTDPLIIEDILDPLTKFSLIHRNPGKNLYSIHRMVQVVLRERMGEIDQKMWSERVVKAVNCAFPEVEFSNWNTCDILLAHAKACSELIDKYGFENPEAANLLNGAGCYLRVRARYEEAHPFFIRALEIREKIFKPESQEIAKSLNSLAGLYLDMGKYDAAEPLYKSALDIRERILKPDHPDVATSLNNLASLYKAQGKNDDSEPLFKRSLEIYEKALGSTHPDFATSLNNLALLYHDQGKNEDSELLYKRALEINEKALGSAHPGVAKSLNNLASLYKSQGKYAKTAPLYLRAIEIAEKSLGEDHPDFLTYLTNYGFFLRKIKTKPRELAKIQNRIKSIENKRQKEKHK